MTAIDLSGFSWLQLWVYVNNAPADRRLWTIMETAAEAEIVRREDEARAA